MHRTVFALLLVGVLLAGCTQSPPAATPLANASSLPVPTAPPALKNASVEAGDVVSVEYVGRLEDGTVFDTNVKSEAEKANLTRPSYDLLTFLVGGGQMIKGFDQAVVGMKVNETKTVQIPPEEAYGARSPVLVKVFPRKDLEALGGTAEVGVVVQASNGAVGNITAVNDSFITVDFNPRLAGKTLVFDITVRKAQRRGTP